MTTHREHAPPGGAGSGAGPVGPREGARRSVEAVWRIEAPRLVGALVRIVQDLGTAEELAQDALVAALEQWPESGVPRRPGAWLLTVARRRAIDLVRRDRRLAEKLPLLARDAEAPAAGGPDAYAEVEAELDQDAIDDDVLRLICTACHPVLSREARVALTLRLIGGLSTEEIARAFLVPESTVAQRIVRAKRTLAARQVPYEVPGGAELTQRLESVLEVVYLVFNEGYAATSGEDWTRPGLCADALRLARVLAGLLPGEPEVLGLAALLELQSSRLPARADASGAPVLLPDQDRGRWDRLLIRRGFAALAAAEAAGRERGRPPGPYLLQAAIAACHASAIRAEETDWGRIAQLYALLDACAPSPVVAVNRAVAVGMAEGPAAGLALLDGLGDSGARELTAYHLLSGVRGDLLARLGRTAEARREFERAAELTRNAAERELLLRRARALPVR
ncbi:RNA polymerase sigma factor [Phaeacidiphilus oryzae]|uniref:RNA polymerase sigma factor n=1 Tax=Phaeacidiphilus oryzae TaxID=348818 RepID=UPI000A02610F|nr:sigma-70 family RNA polymerase sigma factor [Phaeacidiphilus oryzae]